MHSFEWKYVLKQNKYIIIFAGRRLPVDSNNKSTTPQNQNLGTLNKA